MSNILVFDDEVDGLLGYLPLNLEDDGHAVTKCVGLSEGWAALEGNSAYDLVVLDIMFPIREKDDAVYRELTKRKPRGEEDAMKAGLALAKQISKKNIPIVVVTHVTRGTAKGREIREELDRLIADQLILGVWEKPPDDDFYAFVNSLGAGDPG